MIQIYEQSPILAQIRNILSKKPSTIEAQSFLMSVFHLNQTYQKVLMLYLKLLHNLYLTYIGLYLHQTLEKGSEVMKNL